MLNMKFVLLKFSLFNKLPLNFLITIRLELFIDLEKRTTNQKTLDVD